MVTVTVKIKMEHRALVYLLCALGVFHRGLAALIQTQQDVTAAVGDEACLSCQLLKSKEILQITWQKVLPEGEENVATYNKYFGQRVNADFQGKVEIKNNGVQNCSIVITNVTEEDEGCYRCVFNAYPDGALIGNTCLKVYTRAFSAPQIEPQIEEVRMTTAEVQQSAEGSSWIIMTVVFSVVAVVCAAVIITVLLKRKPCNSSSRRDPENRTPNKQKKQTTERNRTPLMQKANELMRWMSPGKKNESDSSKVSSSTTGTNQQPPEMKTPSAQKENEQVRLTSTGRKTERASKVSPSTRGINRQLFLTIANDSVTE